MPKIIDKAGKKVSSKNLETRDEHKARLAQILDRGITNEKLNVEFLEADGLVGCWVRENDGDIAKYHALGFEIYEDEEQKGLHGTADNRRRVGDVILMFTSIDNWNILQEINEDRKKKRLVATAKKEYLTMSQTRGGAPTIGNVEGSEELGDFDTAEASREAL